MSSFSGSLQSKKKSELQSIAVALNISEQGTKDDLQARIKKHLDDNQAELEDNSRFSGLYGSRRRRGSQPPKDVAPPPSKRSVPQVEIKPRRQHMLLEPVAESTPVKDMRDVSFFLKNPQTPDDEDDVETYVEPLSSARRVPSPGTPSSLPPLPPSVETSMVVDRSIIDHIPRPPSLRMQEIVQAMKRKEEAVMQSSQEMLISTRSFLSNTRTIWSLTAVFELLYILLTVIPWHYWQVPLGTSPEVDAELIPPPPSYTKLFIPYPPLSAFKSNVLWSLLMHWFTPSLLLPFIVGTLISFRPPPPAPSEVVLDEDGDVIAQRTTMQPKVPFDPLTASIVRLAAQIAYPYSTNPSQAGGRVDVLGFRWRVLGASVCLAFSFAEAIFDRDFSPSQSQRPISRMITPIRRALTAEPELESPEVD
ncbi:hypothetical protein D9758_007894 [Tetrapyrgos nigripes]|uniref:SAP domain-containing protein n=1 Tax=Tetrapyrgos nigripes TaxID=182062 RepID=A0A8H5FXV0_9AGAR|nr:hypothetical protein D9758_007894 [Tetrapyrgos nigripes]